MNLNISDRVDEAEIELQKALTVADILLDRYFMKDSPEPGKLAYYYSQAKTLAEITRQYIASSMDQISAAVCEIRKENENERHY